MIIKITKKNKRNTLVCTRQDGTYTKSDLGPNLPFHDMAHYVAERRFKLKEGFYGNIAKGFSVEQLSDKNVIKTLGQESWLAEILARALGSLHVGACDKKQFVDIVQQELNGRYTLPMPVITDQVIDELLLEYHSLIEQWNSLTEGGSLELEF